MTAAARRWRRWAGKNLFDGVGNTALTIVTAVVLGWVVYSVGRFVLIDAEWGVIETNRRLLFIGRFPREEEWRLWPPVFLAALAGGLWFGLWTRLSRRDAAWIIAGLAFVFLLLADGSSGLRLGGAGMLAGAAYAAARYSSGRPLVARYVRRAAVAAAVALIPFTLAVLTVGGPSTELWGGYASNIILASVAMAFSLPLGIALALARRSSILTVRYPAIAFIEGIRAGPLVVWLFVSRYVLPDFMPPVLGLDELDLMLRVMVMFTFFTSAYIAEIVRGGLQSVGRGQVEAASALGLGAVATTVFIVLPQALRAVIPALVGQLISLWKDTSLIFIVGILDFLDAGTATLFQAEFTDRQMEVYLFVAFGYWVVAFAMSRLSVRLERELGLGTR